jgi:hypothetical protein
VVSERRARHHTVANRRPPVVSTRRTCSLSGASGRAARAAEHHAEADSLAQRGGYAVGRDVSRIVSSQDQLRKIGQRFVHFADEARGSSALYAHLSPKIAAADDLLALLLVAPAAQRRANLPFAAVHDLLLQGVEHPVARYYPSVNGSTDPLDEEAFDLFRDFCLSHHSRICSTIARRHTQTNAVRRTAAFLPIIQRLSAHWGWSRLAAAVV